MNMKNLKTQSHSSIQSHACSFEGGVKLSRMSASWFISYLYHIIIDLYHRNWERLNTKDSRLRVFNRTQKEFTANGVPMHLLYVTQIISMDVRRLATNHIGLSGQSVIMMAKELFSRMDPLQSPYIFLPHE